MGYFILIVLFFIVLILFCGYYRRKICRIMNAPIVCPPLDNALKSASDIGRFLNERCVAIGGQTYTPKGEVAIEEHKLKKIFMGEEIAIAEFIRLCHAVGCEVIVRQVGTDDIEDKTYTNMPEYSTEYRT